MTAKAVEVVIIGAGPYGLSIAAHLGGAGIPFRIFGRPMSTWRDNMLRGTFLKSFGFASSLFDPESNYTLAHFCQERGLTYSDAVDPVSLKVFVEYGLAFQKRFAPNLEPTNIVSVERRQGSFLLMTETGELLAAHRVIVAAGITHFDYTPEVFADLPKQFVSHSYEHSDVGRFKGQRVAVVGAGASAADIAGELNSIGAEAHLITRKDAVSFHNPPAAEPRPVIQRILKPRSGLGLSWRCLFCSDFPLAFYFLPLKIRLRAVKKINGPASGWFTKDRVVGQVSMHVRSNVNRAEVAESRVKLSLEQTNSSTKELHVDHVIAATGYQPKLHRLQFLHDSLRSRLSSVDDVVVLTTNFESSIPGLYFVGLASSNNFGPLCRFAYGAKFTAKRVTRHLRDTRT